jgi:hypothetical protein
MDLHSNIQTSFDSVIFYCVFVLESLTNSLACNPVPTFPILEYNVFAFGSPRRIWDRADGPSFGRQPGAAPYVSQGAGVDFLSVRRWVVLLSLF